jgi:hypothetical protein
MVRSLTLAFLVSFFAVTSAFAETIRGRITDPQSKPVAHARVLITHGTVTVVTITTSADGQFGPVSVPAGEYDITVAAPGCAPRRNKHIAAAAADADVVLEVGRSEVVALAAQVDRPLSRVTEASR